VELYVNCFSAGVVTHDRRIGSCLRKRLCRERVAGFVEWDWAFSVLLVKDRLH
jgi:hypothetical protein